MIEKFNVNLFDKLRMLHIYLPDDYYNSDQRYPVMYMYDGHNLFSDEDATYGTSWKIKEFLDNYDKKFIIVGIECDHEGNNRLSEYCPYDIKNSYFNDVHGYGDKFMDWVVYDLKVMIDKHYRTIPFRECTGIAGSSMGGLMALYTIIKYNNYFSKAACISPAIGLCMNELKKELKDINSDTKVYFSFGKHEVRNKKGLNYMLNNIKYFNDYFISKDAYSYINVVSDGYHNEASWQKENKIYFDFLWK